MSARQTNLDVALRYAKAGFKIFPCGTDKRPLVPSWAMEKTADTARIAAWWAAHPEALIGLPMKPHGLLVFDADRHRDGEDGVAHFRALCTGHEPLPPHPIVLTANGGEHHIFRQPANKIGNRKLGNGLETRGYKDDNDGGYIIAAGSRLPDGRSWQLFNGSPSLLNAAPPEPPAWLVDHARERREEQQQTDYSGRAAGRREEAYAAKALDNLARELAVMEPENGRNNQLNIAALKLGPIVARAWIGRATVEGRLFDACVANGLVRDTGANAVRATIRSGLEAGLKQPHADLPDRDRPPETPERETAKHIDPSAWQHSTFTAADLQMMEFPPISWIIPDIVPAEGVTLLASRPKFGKSWFAYDLCIGATMDRFILGEIKPKQGDVLYLALEDSRRRLQRRMAKLLPFGSKWSERLTLTTKWRRLHEGGLEDIRTWHDHTKAKGGNPILAVVDVLAKVRKPTGNRPAYEADYEALTGLAELASELNIAIIVIHHVRKMQSDDLMEMVSGTYGITGAADTVLVMANKPNGAVLDIRGRDVESAEMAIQFDKSTCRWRVLGNAAEVHLSEQQSKILAALREAGRPLEAQEIEAVTEIKRASLDKALLRLAAEEVIKRVGRGLYALPEWQPPPTKGGKILFFKSGKSGKSGKENGPLPDSLPDTNSPESIKKSDVSGKSGRSGSPGTPSAATESTELPEVSPIPKLPDLPDCQIDSQATENIAKSETPKSGNEKTGLPDLPDSSGTPPVTHQVPLGGRASYCDPGPIPECLLRAPRGGNGQPARAPSDYDAAPEELAERGGPGSGIPFMITVAQRERLKDRGYTEDEILVMTPAEAQKILRERCRTHKTNGEPPEVCAQCGAAEPGPLPHAFVVEGEVPLHRECLQFWLRAHPQPTERAILLVQITEIKGRTLQ
jgi:Bifunctional DNA primase/polymerase, N-terminal/AAA domain